MAGKHRDTSPSRPLAVATLLALAGGLLVLSGTALAASIVGLAVAAPLLLLFSLVLVPVALTATGMVVSGALAVGGLALLSRLARNAAANPPDYVYVQEGKRRVAEMAGPKTANAAAGQAMHTKELGV